MFSKIKSGLFWIDECSENNKLDISIFPASINSLDNNESIFEFFFLSFTVSICATLSRVVCGCITNELCTIVSSRIEEIILKSSER